ncbi:MAG: DUF5906 domain-containing protein [Negativicutes bacterium]
MNNKSFDTEIMVEDARMDCNYFEKQNSLQEERSGQNPLAAPKTSNLYGWEIVKELTQDEQEYDTEIQNQAINLPAVIKETKEIKPKSLRQLKIAANRRKAPFMYFKGVWLVSYFQLLNWFAGYGQFMMKDDFKMVDNILYGWNGKYWTKSDKFVCKHIFNKFFDNFGIAIESKYMKELLEICYHRDFIPSLPGWDWNKIDYQKEIIVTFQNGTLKFDLVNRWTVFYKDTFYKERDAVYSLNTNYTDDLMQPDYWKETFVGRYLLEFYDDKSRDQLQKFLASVLITQFEIQQMLVILGDGGDGKGTLMGAVRNIFGNVISALRVSEWQGKHDTSALIGSILNITSERPDRDINLDTFKSIVANDEIQMNPKYKELHNYKPFCKHVMTVNSLPAIELDSAAMRRLPVIKTCKTIPMNKRNAKFKTDFAKDKAGLVSFMLQGLYKLKQDNFAFLTGTPELQEELVYQNDSLVYDFIHDCIDLTDNISDYTITANAFEVFDYWQMNNGKNSKPITRVTFGKKIINVAKNLGKVNVKTSTKRIPKSGTTRVLTGFAIKSEWITKYTNYNKQIMKFSS